MPLSDAIAHLPGSTVVLVSHPCKRSSLSIGRAALSPVRMRLADLARLIDRYPFEGSRLLVRVTP